MRLSCQRRGRRDEWVGSGRTERSTLRVKLVLAPCSKQAQRLQMLALGDVKGIQKGYFLAQFQRIAIADFADNGLGNLDHVLIAGAFGRIAQQVFARLQFVAAINIQMLRQKVELCLCGPNRRRVCGCGPTSRSFSPQATHHSGVAARSGSGETT